MSEFLQVVTTLPDEAQARALAAELVQGKWAACVQISGPVESVYRWKGKVETAREWVCAAKTRREFYAQVEATIRRLHPYDTPEIIALPIVAGSQAYLDWITEVVLPK